MNLSINFLMSRFFARKFLCRFKLVWQCIRWILFALFSRLLLEIFAVQNIPFPAALRDRARQRRDLLPDDFVDMIFALKKVLQHLFRLG